jgi:hypothetical protein
MTKFLKLTNFVLNTNDIHKIVIQSNKYIFHIVSKKMDGFSWGIGWFSLGNISSYSYDFEVCETKHSTDYKIVTDWIDKNE